MPFSTLMMIILLPIVILAIVFSIVFRPLFKKYYLKKRLLKEGLAGTGTLVSSRETNMRVNNSLVMELTLDIKNSFGETWQTKIKQTIGLSQMYLLQPGAIFNILYDPNDKNKVVVSNTQITAANSTTHTTV